MSGCMWTDDYGRMCGTAPVVASYVMPLLADEFGRQMEVSVELCRRHDDKVRPFQSALRQRVPLPEIPIDKPSLRRQVVTPRIVSAADLDQRDQRLGGIALAARPEPELSFYRPAAPAPTDWDAGDRLAARALVTVLAATIATAVAFGSWWWLYAKG